MKNATFAPIPAPQSSPHEWGNVHQVLAFLVGFSPFFSIAATNVAFSVFLLLWMIDLFRKKTNFHPYRTSFDFVLLAYFLVWAAAALAGFSPLSSFKKIIVFQHPLVFYVLLFSYRGELIPSALYGLGVGAGLNVLYGWGQLVLWQWVYDYANGSRPEWLMMVREKWRAYLTLSPGQGRIHGAFHLLTYSELLLPPFFFFGARFLERGKSMLYLLAFLLAGGALIFTAERGPFLGALFGIALMAFHHPRRRLLIGPVSILMLMLWYNPVFRHRMGGSPVEQPETSTPLSSMGKGSAENPVTKTHSMNTISRVITQKANLIKHDHRMNLWRGGLYIASRHLFLGVGPGQIGPVTAIYKKNADFPPNPEGQENDLHSFYIQRLAEMGLPGLVVSVWVIFVFFGTGREFYRQRETISIRFTEFKPELVNALSLGVWALFSAYGVINLTERAFDDAEVSIVFWILAASSVWFTRHFTQTKGIDS
jgi:hypothetical protein